MTKTEHLLASTKTVFNTQDLSAIWGIPEKRRLLEEVKYYLRSKKLISIHRGVYVLSENATNYSVHELVQKIVPLSYISLTTALAMHGLIFQYEGTLHAAALISKKYHINDQAIEYHKFKEGIFFDQTGLQKRSNFTMAGPERAVCDTLYIMPGHGIDNPNELDRTELEKISMIYKNMRLEREIKSLIRKM